MIVAASFGRAGNGGHSSLPAEGGQQPERAGEQQNQPPHEPEFAQRVFGEIKETGDENVRRRRIVG